MSLGIGIKTFELILEVTGFLEGCIDDWPAKLQDAIYKALEAKSHAVELPLCLIHSRCEVDPGTEPGEKDKFYVHCLASEIVAQDIRALNGQKVH